jgi:hypothetical protein
MTSTDATGPATVAGHVRRLLAALGDTPRQVAARLAAEGITGLPDSPSCCPIANYLCAADARLSGVEVSEDEICLDVAEGRSVFLAPPAAVTAFVTAFDAAQFPHLIAYREVTP